MTGTVSSAVTARTLYRCIRRYGLWQRPAYVPVLAWALAVLGMAPIGLEVALMGAALLPAVLLICVSFDTRPETEGEGEVFHAALSWWATLQLEAQELPARVVIPNFHILPECHGGQAFLAVYARRPDVFRRITPRAAMLEIDHRLRGVPPCAARGTGPRLREAA
ncbi:MAG: hypothetical protein AB1768_17710 [Pseudomonadota bacterium]|jgi:hypothetical protein